MKAVSTIIAILFLHIVHAQEFEGDNRTFINKPEAIRNAKVSAVEVYYYRLYNEKVVDSSLVQLVTYDSLGNMLQILATGYQWDYTYDQRKLKRAVFADRRRGHKVIYSVFYDEYGRISTQSTVSTRDSSTQYYRFETGKDNKPVKVFIKGGDGQYKLLKIYEYIGDDISSIKYFTDKKLKNADLFESDEDDGRVVRYRVTGRKKQKISESLYKGGRLIRFHEEPPVISSRWMYIVTSPVYEHYFYNNKGLVTEKVSKQLRIPISRVRFIYTFRD